MTYKWIGAILITGSCAGFGFSLALHQLKETRLLSAFGLILEDMLRELSYHLTPLPELIRHAAQNAPSVICRVFTLFADNLDRQILPDASSCMESALRDTDLSYTHLSKLLSLLGNSLGRFDLAGQISSLNTVRQQCKQEFLILRSDQHSRIRSYRVLGLCAGISLVLLLI